MNEPFENNERDDEIARKLSKVAEQTDANSQFAAELEQRLRKARQPKTGWFAATLRQISPAVRWVALMALLVLVLSWSIKSLIPAPQPATNSTPGLPDIAAPTPAPVDQTPTSAVPTEGDYDWRGAKLFLAT
ncbi:MAG TPA: hypothetical protein VFY25_04690, partial [Anaerolineales bacterium]|nr:hypothetical protein [Anaerolineales bacterium]